jgi:3-hydroxy-9,10-secoandrosta-1,3,5(10)-triene-9,17-dione monooxygenase reductase component
MSTTPVSDHLKATVGRALGRVPSGVYIMTARHDGQSAAMMVSWVQQASFNPPAISVALQKDRPIRQMVRASGKFALAVIGEGDSALMKKYARGVPPGQDPFDGVNVLDTPAGLPVPASALAWLECGVINACEFGGDHEVVVARVTDGALLRDGASFTHIRGNGFHY